MNTNPEVRVDNRFGKSHVNPFPHMPILGSSNSAANKSMMSKIWTNGNTII